MTQQTLVPVLMAGGSGTRLWPMSREQYPKQFLNLLGDQSLLQSTVQRAMTIPGARAPVVIGSEAHRFLIAEQLQQLGITDPAIVLEPEARNTAPAAAVAAHHVAQAYGPDALVFLMAADQAVDDVAAFIAAAEAAAQVAAQGYIVTFGIKPTRAETGYGWIKAGPALAHGQGYSVDRFVEKPDLAKAEQLLADGGYYWNGGMFLFPAGLLLQELKTFEPDMARHSVQALDLGTRDQDFMRLEPNAFKACRKESIDYAVMEKTTRIALVPLDAGWDDVGSWTFLSKRPQTDSDGNHCQGDVLCEDAHGNLVHADSRLVALVGINNQIVVETDDAILVAAKDRVQDVKKIVQRLNKSGRSEAQTRSRCYRPWGYYETIALGDRFQVKRIMVKPGHKLSLQMHHHRAEHWVVVTGTALVTCNDKSFLLTEDRSTYIPLGNTHRLENPGKLPLELIEVQSGAYLGEDDIVRFNDVYGRAPEKADKPRAEPQKSGGQPGEATARP